MTSFQQKNCEKAWDHIQGGGGEEQSTGTVPMQAQTLDLAEKDFKLTIINMSKERKEAMSEI